MVVEVLKKIKILNSANTVIILKIKIIKQLVPKTPKILLNNIIKNIFNREYVNIVINFLIINIT